MLTAGFIYRDCRPTISCDNNDDTLSKKGGDFLFAFSLQNAMIIDS